MEKDMKLRKFIATTIREYLNEQDIFNNIIAYHISEYNFNEFNSSEHIGNFGTILDASYFLSSKNELYNFGSDGIIYTVKLNPKMLFEFNLDDEGWVSLDFQEKFREQIVGYDNELTDYFEKQNVTINNIDCIALTNLEYLNNKNTIEYIVLDDNIITILNKERTK